MRISDWSSDVCSSDLPLEQIAFDRDLLKGPVGVRRARAGEMLKLLDGRDASLDDGFLLVNDAEDRKRAVEGKSVSVRVGLGGRRIIQKKQAAHTRFDYDDSMLAYVKCI